MKLFNVDDYKPFDLLEFKFMRDPDEKWTETGFYLFEPFLDHRIITILKTANMNETYMYAPHIKSIRLISKFNECEE